MTESPRPQDPSAAVSGPSPRRAMSRKDRLVALIERLRDGRTHRAADLARDFGLSLRTLYRDMAILQASGVPVTGTKGSGYRMSAAVTLPPLNLSMAEMEALHLGLAVMTEASDPGLAAAARSLAHKIDLSLPEDRVPAATAWSLAVHPFADTAAGIRHMPAIRDAIRNRRKLRIAYPQAEGADFVSVLRPLRLDYWGRVWTLGAWCERSKQLKSLRLDRISDLVELSGTSF